MNIQTKITIISALLIFGILISAHLISSLPLNVDQQRLYPGEKTKISIDIENTLDDDIEDVSLVLYLSNTQFTSISGSETDIDNIDSDDKESLDFDIKASQSIKPGDYNIPYTLTYTIDDNNLTKKTEKGAFGITVGAKTELTYTIETETNVIGQKGKLSLKIVNKGLGDIRFVSVKLNPQGYNLLGSDTIYIGTVSSDDFETATYDVVFNSQSPKLIATITYRDFDNNKISEDVNLPIKVYTKDEALKLGIIKSNSSIYYLIVFFIIVIAYITYRIIRKRRRNNKRKEA